MVELWQQHCIGLMLDVISCRSVGLFSSSLSCVLCYVCIYHGSAEASRRNAWSYILYTAELPSKP